eukprot:scaffold80040_cov81-Phaeocystis_antarctica.AAC.1
MSVTPPDPTLFPPTTHKRYSRTALFRFLREAQTDYSLVTISLQPPSSALGFKAGRLREGDNQVTKGVKAITLLYT